jgi:hypothetical protein
MCRVFYAILFYFVDYGIPLSQTKIVLFILANHECLIRWRRCINIVFIFAGQWKAELNISQHHFHLPDRTSWVLFSLAPGNRTTVNVEPWSVPHQQSPIRSPVVHSRLHRSVPHQQSPIRSALYVSCILCHFVLFCWLRNSPFLNKDRVIYISQLRMPNKAAALHQHRIYFRRHMTVL